MCSILICELQVDQLLTLPSKVRTSQMSANRDNKIAFERMFRTGMKGKRQLMKVAGISEATYYRWKAILLSGGRLERKQRAAKPTKFLPHVRRSLGQLVAQNPERSSAELAELLNQRNEVAVSASSVRRILIEMGNSRSVCEDRELTPENKQERLGYANSNKNTDWKRIWAYDEVYFNLWGSRHHVRSNRRTKYRNIFRKQTKAQKSVSLGYVAAFSFNSKSALCRVPRHWHVPQLRDVWENELLPSINWDPSQRRCRAFILDNDGRHHSQALVDSATENGLNRNGYLPPNSPDLNPAENIWNIMKQYVLRQHPTNERELRIAIEEAYETVTPDILRSEFDSLPRRIQAVLDNNGDRIRY